MVRLLGCLVVSILLALAAPAAAVAGDVLVFAAASLKNAMDDVAAHWSGATGHEATISYAGSAALARQIEQGAPADVFISANEEWMDALEADGLVEAGTRVNLLGNSLVVIAHGHLTGPIPLAPRFDLAGWLGDRKLAMALVDAVPAGLYGKAALQNLGVWEAVRPKVAQTDNVRAALALVATGEAPFGIVYATDASAETRVGIVGAFPEDSHPPIVYPAAAIAGRDNPLASDFLAFLRSDTARAAFERQGFRVLD